MNYKDTVDTGRTLLRSDRLCESCEMRLTLGEPKAADTWPARIHIDERNMDLLLVAAAEYRDLCAECSKCQHYHGWVADKSKPPRDICQEYDEARRIESCPCSEYEARGADNAIDFLDWVRTDALAPVGEISPIKAVEPEPVSLAEKRRRHAAGAA